MLKKIIPHFLILDKPLLYLLAVTLMIPAPALYLDQIIIMGPQNRRAISHSGLMLSRIVWRVNHVSGVVDNF